MPDALTPNASEYGQIRLLNLHEDRILNSVRAAADAERYVVGREWTTKFDNASADAALFDSVNFTRTTDAGKTCLTATNSTNTALFTLKGQQLKNVDVLIRYRYVSDPTYLLAAVQMMALARYVAPASGTALADYLSNCMFAADERAMYVPTAGAARLAVESMRGGVAGTRIATNSIVPPTMDGADVTKHRYLRLRVIDDVLYARNWFADVVEPDTWDIIARSRSANPLNPGGVAANLTADDIPMGSAGVLAQYTASFIYELTIRELVSTTSSAVTNATFTEDENTGTPQNGGSPHSWYSFPTHANTTYSKPTARDRLGRLRPELKVVVASPGTVSGALWKQRIWNSLCPGGNAAWPRLNPYPRTAFSSLMEVRVWSKGTGIVNPAPSALFDGAGLGACFDNYYYDVLGAQANIAGTDDYYWWLGPNVGGVGTWDWYETVRVMTINRPQAISYMDLAFGIHDAAVSGTLEIRDPSFTPLG